MNPDTGFLKKLTAHSDIAFAITVITILTVMILPLPAFFLDLLLAANISLSVIIILVTMYMTKPLQFSVFPGLLLVLTLFRLSLNVASTRLILGEAYAGEVIEAFGNFVVGGNYVLGFIVFLILIIIQFVVITKGATRIAEVGARFTLDAMPGKQMSIDADLNSGLINEQQARERREEIAQEADFYGAMDGSSKFVRGDAIAGIIITSINIIAGFIIGMAQHNLSFADALKTYTLLTVGDGLVSQIPALIISTSAGIIVTRAASDSNLGQDITRQLTLQPRAILISAGLLFFFGMVPGMPTLPFSFLSIVIGAIGYFSLQASKKETEEQEIKAEEQEQPEESEKIEDLLKVDPMEIEIGYSLIPLVDNSQGGDLLERIGLIRKQLAQDLGIIVPPIRIRDNIQLDSQTYRIKLRGLEVAGGQIMPDYLMAMTSGEADEKMEGIPTTEPAFNLPALWITTDKKEFAELIGFTVVEPSAVLATHLSEIIKNEAGTLLNRQQVKDLTENLKKDNPTLVEELIPNTLTIGNVQKVLQNLLRERVPIRDLETILEALADYAVLTKDMDVLTEYVRGTLHRVITHLYMNENNEITVLTIDPKLEKTILDIVKNPNFNGMVALPPTNYERFRKDLTDKVKQMLDQAKEPIILCSAAIRLYLKRMVEELFPNVVVLSYNEISQGTNIVSLGMVSGG